MNKFLMLIAFVIVSLAVGCAPFGYYGNRSAGYGMAPSPYGYTPQAYGAVAPAANVPPMGGPVVMATPFNGGEAQGCQVSPSRSLTLRNSTDPRKRYAIGVMDTDVLRPTVCDSRLMVPGTSVFQAGLEVHYVTPRRGTFTVTVGIFDLSYGKLELIGMEHLTFSLPDEREPHVEVFDTSFRHL